MKKWIFPICVFAYLVFITVTTETVPKETALGFIYQSIGKMPKNMVVALSLLVLLAVGMVAQYLRETKAGDQDGK